MAHPTQPSQTQTLLGDTTLGSTRAWCPLCQDVEHALYSASATGVYMDRICPQQGTQRVRIAASPQWFTGRVPQARKVRRNKKVYPVRNGCPFDCGPCENHVGQLRLPIFSVTNNCNLQCPICFTHNRPDTIYNKSLQELQSILEHIARESQELDLLNLTGGEPTLHPNILDLLNMCAKQRFRRISMNSNGLRIGADRAFAERIKQSGVQVVLSLDTLDAGQSRIIHGKDIVAEKIAALAMLEELNIPTVLLLVWIPTVNDSEVPQLIRDWLPKTFICGVTVQNMTYTGFFGSNFSPRIHSTLEDVELALAAQADFSTDDFFPHGSYHPLCYSVGYFLVDGTIRIPLARLAPRELLSAATQDSYLLKATPELEKALRAGVDKLWAQGATEDELGLLRLFIRQYTAMAAKSPQGFHPMVKTVTIHAHMDQDNFDLNRLCQCGDMVPDEAGAMVPACSYNLIYRQQDSRFWAQGQ